MGMCSCGCGEKVKFGRGYLNSRSDELRVVSRFGTLVEQKLTERPIPNTPQRELEGVRKQIIHLTTLCRLYSGKLHDYSVGATSEREASEVLSNRLTVFRDETSLIDVVCYSACFCLLNGSLSDTEFLQEIEKLSSNQRVKAKSSMNIVRAMASEEEQRFLPQL